MSDSAYMGREMPQRDEGFHQALIVLEHISDVIGVSSHQNSADIFLLILAVTKVNVHILNMNVFFLSFSFCSLQHLEANSSG